MRNRGKPAVLAGRIIEHVTLVDRGVELVIPAVKAEALAMERVSGQYQRSRFWKRASQQIKLTPKGKPAALVTK